MNHNVSLAVDRIQQLQEQIPVVSDKALLDVANGVDINRSLLSAQRECGHLGRLWDWISGAERAQSVLSRQTLVVGQAGLLDFGLELSRRVELSHLALEVTQQSLLETRAAVRSTRSEFAKALDDRLGSLERNLGDRVGELEAQHVRLSLRVAAREDLDRVVSAWEAGKTYAGLPWLIQVALVAREVFGSAVGLVDLAAEGPDYRGLLRDKLVGRLTRDIAAFARGWASLDALLEETCDALTGNTGIAAALLEVRSFPASVVLPAPYSFALGSALELACLPDGARPEHLGTVAAAQARLVSGPIDPVAPFDLLVERLVDEAADSCRILRARSRRSPK